jgi:hypothetical protein
VAQGALGKAEALELVAGAAVDAGLAPDEPGRQHGMGLKQELLDSCRDYGAPTLQ